MDYQEHEIGQRNPGNQYAQQEQPPNHMAAASLVMGILGLLGCCCCYGGFLFGGLGILFALLSRTEKHFEGQAKAGLILSSIAMALSLLVLASFLALILADGGLGSGPIRQLPAHPDVPDFPLPDNLLQGFWRGGGLL